MRDLGTVLILVWWALPPAAAVAQPAAAQSVRGAVDSERKTGTYLKGGLAHWQGDISSQSLFTNWNVDQLGVAYDLTSANVELEAYFGDTFLQLSGFSIGYRKDVLRIADSGHMVYGEVFRDFDLKALALKIGGGGEWGMPSLNFDRTEFEFLPDGTTRYRHTHPNRNADVPFVGTTTDGAIYPFAEVSVVQRPWLVLFEAGMRINFVGFNFDDYEVRPNDEVSRAFTRKTTLVPYLFFNFGLRLF